MSGIVVLGAGGRAGRRAVAEAVRRGHEVTAVVRDPARAGELTGSPARIVAGDVTDAARVAELGAGQDALISAAAVYGPGTDPAAFFDASTRALLGAVRGDGPSRLVVVGLSAVLPDPEGRPLYLSAEPGDVREFCRAHGRGLEILRSEGTDVDWLYASPAGDFDHGGTRTGRYRVAPGAEPADRISYQDLAVALLDEVERPRHHRTHLAVAGGTEDAGAGG
ncbi:NAD(P)H-binding protein [Streptomyces sp. RFCAC02]|uniref:NAD(P)-dependent oxidoreductase n=1 Tax=Streptomyces sp. RFCAC02 TaxID=2499143 RepID=UPI0010215171|nr:NAD(P)H-binding protein [Streptomyces sp. RFCAC02]